MIVDGQKVNLDVYLGGDYKVNEVCLTDGTFIIIVSNHFNALNICIYVILTVPDYSHGYEGSHF